MGSADVCREVVLYRKRYISTPQWLVFMLFRFDISLCIFLRWESRLVRLMHQQTKNTFSCSRWAEWAYVTVTATAVETRDLLPRRNWARNANHMIETLLVKAQLVSYDGKDKPHATKFKSIMGHHQIPEHTKYSFEKKKKKLSSFCEFKNIETLCHIYSRKGLIYAPNSQCIACRFYPKTGRAQLVQAHASIFQILGRHI